MKNISTLTKIEILEKAQELFSNINDYINDYVKEHSIPRTSFFDLVQKKVKYDKPKMNIYFYKKLESPLSWSDEEVEAILNILNDSHKILIYKQYNEIVANFNKDITSKKFTRVFFAEYFSRMYNTSTFNINFYNPTRWRKHIHLIIITYKYIHYIESFNDKVKVYYSIDETQQKTSK